MTDESRAAALAAASAASFPWIPTWLGIQLSHTRLPWAGEALQETQDGGGEADVVPGVGLLQGLEPHTGVGVQHHGDSQRCCACYRACRIATSSVWRVGQWPDVLHAHLSPPVTNAAPDLPFSGSTEPSVL